jgi:hypothetical protein
MIISKLNHRKETQLASSNSIASSPLASLSHLHHPALPALRPPIKPPPPPPNTREDSGIAPSDLWSPMAGAERPYLPIDHPRRPGGGSSGEAGARHSPATSDDDGLAVSLAPPLLRASGFVSLKFCCAYGFV